MGEAAIRGMKALVNNLGLSVRQHGSFLFHFSLGFFSFFFEKLKLSDLSKMVSKLCVSPLWFEGLKPDGEDDSKFSEVPLIPFLKEVAC